MLQALEKLDARQANVAEKLFVPRDTIQNYFDLLAPEWCKPHHRIESRSSYRKFCDTFHKVIHGYVENLTE
jgi:hypothetical protein